MVEYFKRVFVLLRMSTQNQFLVNSKTSLTCHYGNEPGAWSVAVIKKFSATKLSNIKSYLDLEEDATPSAVADAVSQLVVTCPKCHAASSARAAFCSTCKHKQPLPNFCVSCNSRCTGDSCTACGAALGEVPLTDEAKTEALSGMRRSCV